MPLASLHSACCVRHWGGDEEQVGLQGYRSPNRKTNGVVIRQLAKTEKNKRRVSFGVELVPQF